MNKMLEIRNILPGDMEYVKANPFETYIKLYPNQTPPETSYTCLFDGKIVAVGGIREYWKGVGESWLILTKHAQKKGIFGLIAYNAIKKKLNEIIEDEKFWRIEANARADFPKAIRFIESLGFEFEGIKRKYTPDQCDMRSYSKIIKEHL